MIRKVLILLMLAGCAWGATDRSAYKFMAFGNIYSGTNRFDSIEISEKFDMILNGTDFITIFEGANSYSNGKMWFGPYASPHEMDMYETDKFYWYGGSHGDDSSGCPSGLGANCDSITNRDYNTRITDTASHWKIIYAESYMTDSVSVSVESLYIHIADTAITITQQDEPQRIIDRIDTLALGHKRLTTEYWNNGYGPDDRYPFGYLNLANGYNNDMKAAIASSYFRHFVADTGKHGLPNRTYECFYMDNQQRNGQSGRLNSYYTINSSAGGPSNQMDWIEFPGDSLETNSVCQRYFDSSTARVDSAIWARLKSYNVRPFANVDRFTITSIDPLIGFVAGVTLETGVDWSKGWYNFNKWYIIADSFCNSPRYESTYVAWECRGDAQCTNNGSWRDDSARIYMANYSFFLTARDTNAFFGPYRFNDSLRWKDVYRVNLGEPVEFAITVDSQVVAGATLVTRRRKYINSGDTGLALFRNGDASLDYVSDSTNISLGGTYYLVDINGDTASSGVTSIYLLPYEGAIFTTVAAGAASSSTNSTTVKSGTIKAGIIK